MTLAIQEALEKISEPSFPPVASIDEEIGALEERWASLLGVEQLQADVIRDEIARLKQDRIASLYVETSRETPPTLSPEVLTWRHSEHVKGVPVPKLAPLEIDRAVCRFGVSRIVRMRDLTYADTVPAPIRSYYDDVWDGVGRRASRRWTRMAELSWRFEGVIPDDVRERTVGYVEDFGEDEIFLLAEAPLETWRYVEKRASAEERANELLDPLVVGAKAGRLWLLDAFDPTPIERYIADEFTS